MDAEQLMAELADALEMKSRMTRIKLQQLEVFICYLADIWRERLI